MKTTLILSAMLWMAHLQAQTTTDSLAVKNDSVYITVDGMPEYPGGEAALLRYMASISYPAEAKKKDIQGQVFVKFIVEKDGKVSNVVAARSSGSEILDHAAIAHVQHMAVWKPGHEGNELARVQYVVPIKFVLR